MFITIVFNTEYMHCPSRIKWYLKNLYHCKEYGWIIITHEYLFKNFEKLQESVDDRFFEDFEMERLTIDDFNNINQYIIPDKVFEDKEKMCGSRTEMLFEVTKNRFPELETHLLNAVNQIKTKDPNKKIDGVFHILEGFKSIRTICNKLNIPLITYVFSAIRKVHGYRHTLFSANMYNRLYCSDECKTRYNQYKSENQNSEIPIFENREIIALIGKERTLPLIKLLDYDPQYELFVCGDGFVMVPHIFEYANYTDEDLYYECNKAFRNDEMRFRQHPMQLNQIQIDYSEVRSDPAATILSCKRTTAVASQIVLKALLWNRTAVMMKNVLPFSYMCEKDYNSESKIDLKFLNYYFFCYLIPSELMFDENYWKWRLTNPEETEIYRKHLEFYSSNMGVPKNLFSEVDKNKRFKALLELRNCQEDLIEALLLEESKPEVNFDLAISKLIVEYQEGKTKTISKTFWRLNEYKNGNVTSKFRVKLKGIINKVYFFPLDDKAGFIKIEEIQITSKNKIIKTITSNQEMTYYPKNIGKYEIIINPSIATEFEVNCAWKYESIKSKLINNLN